MSAKYTPGPWSIDPEGEIAVAVEAQGAVIAYLQVEGIQEHEANAQLIAAAPELHVALRQCVSLLQSAPTLGGFAGLAVLTDALEVLAKVEGSE